ncbi:MAG: iron ABC transporter permease [Trueperaceae bacterium]|nr:MAG: iron ABC transporter permease [Trueperaceae bacterium]
MTQPARAAGSRPLFARQQRIPPLVILLPSLVVAAATLLPIIYLVLRASGAAGGIWEYMLRPRTLAVLGNTLLLVGSVSGASLCIALPVAWLTSRTDLPGRRLWFVLTTLPLVIPSYVGAYAYVSAFAPGGLVSGLLGVGPPVYGFWGALMVLTLFTYPYLLLTLRAGFRGIDPSLEEASRSLGLSPWKTFFKVTLPLLRPSIAVGSLLVALYVLSDFGAVSMLRYSTFTRAIYIQYENSFNRSNAAVLALMLVALAALLLLIDAQLRGRGRIQRTGVGEAQRTAKQSLGRWRFPAMLFLGATVLVALLGPLTIITFWFGRGLVGAQRFSFDWLAIVNAAGVSLLAALVAVVFSVPVAVLVVRFPSRLSAVLERLTYVGYALPGIVVALALVFFGVRYLPWLYQSLAMLVVAYVLLFLPQAVGNLRATLLQTNPHVEEAARSLGRSPGRVLLEVTLPLLRSGLVTSAMLVFLTTMKELPATLLLRPTGFDTLATRVWSWTEEAFFAQAAPYAILLVLVSSFSLGILLAQDRK